MLIIGHLKNFAQTKLLILMFFVVLLTPTLSHSANLRQSLTEISQLGVSFLENQMQLRGINEENIRIKVTPPDPRLKLGRCTQSLNAFTPMNASLLGHTTVGIKCTSPKWQIYLPAKVEQLTDVWIYTQNYSRGDIINSRSLIIEKRAIATHLQPFLQNAKKLNQLRAVRPLRRGQVVQERDLCLVCKGDQVALVVKASSLTVRMNGTSLDNGLKGDAVTVRNSKSKKLVTGVAYSPNEIRVNL